VNAVIDAQPEEDGAGHARQQVQRPEPHRHESERPGQRDEQREEHLKHRADPPEVECEVGHQADERPERRTIQICRQRRLLLEALRVAPGEGIGDFGDVREGRARRGVHRVHRPPREREVRRPTRRLRKEHERASVGAAVAPVGRPVRSAPEARLEAEATEPRAQLGLEGRGLHGRRRGLFQIHQEGVAGALLVRRPGFERIGERAQRRGLGEPERTLGEPGDRQAVIHRANLRNRSQPRRDGVRSPAQRRLGSGEGDGHRAETARSRFEGVQGHDALRLGGQEATEIRVEAQPGRRPQREPHGDGDAEQHRDGPAKRALRERAEGAFRRGDEAAGLGRGAGMARHVGLRVVGGGSRGRGKLGGEHETALEGVVPGEEDDAAREPPRRAIIDREKHQQRDAPGGALSSALVALTVT
jgi:hypothetical protein